MFVLRFVGVACAVQVLAARVTGKSWESGLQEAAWLASGWRFPATGSIASPGGIALIKYLMSVAVQVINGMHCSRRRRGKAEGSGGFVPV